MNIRKKFSGQFAVMSVFVLCICVSLITGFIFQLTKLKEYKGEIASLNKQISETKEEIKNLKKVDNTQDLETVARERLNMVKPDETIYIDMGRR
ncbi:septum formation initiator family protein [Clostridium sp. CCUG 7971]|uniref:FtsB family cell division protein n=1 Tax=Clostridium sp. CCUG 7971 TaxID=2811414 RepID=UPI001ABA460B|nr:septum formation initiator family protein [Clostridium sp. CCUG 7971]MBO3444060.1 septum formation initiator family protein [Clostridium sp. CCUG 7971]